MFETLLRASCISPQNEKLIKKKKKKVCLRLIFISQANDFACSDCLYI